MSKARARKGRKRSQKNHNTSQNSRQSQSADHESSESDNDMVNTKEMRRWIKENCIEREGTNLGMELRGMGEI